MIIQYDLPVDLCLHNYLCTECLSTMMLGSVVSLQSFGTKEDQCPVAAIKLHKDQQ